MPIPGHRAECRETMFLQGIENGIPQLQARANAEHSCFLGLGPFAGVVATNALDHVKSHGSMIVGVHFDVAVEVVDKAIQPRRVAITHFDHEISEHVRDDVLTPECEARRNLVQSPALYDGESCLDKSSRTLRRTAATYCPLDALVTSYP